MSVISAHVVCFGVLGGASSREGRTRSGQDNTLEFGTKWNKHVQPVMPHAEVRHLGQKLMHGHLFIRRSLLELVWFAQTDFRVSTFKDLLEHQKTNR